MLKVRAYFALVSAMLMVSFSHSADKCGYLKQYLVFFQHWFVLLQDNFSEPCSDKQWVLPHFANRTEQNTKKTLYPIAQRAVNALDIALQNINGSKIIPEAYRQKMLKPSTQWFKGIKSGQEKFCERPNEPQIKNAQSTENEPDWHKAMQKSGSFLGLLYGANSVDKQPNLPKGPWWLKRGIKRSRLPAVVHRNQQSNETNTPVAASNNPPLPTSQLVDADHFLPTHPTAPQRTGIVFQEAAIDVIESPHNVNEASIPQSALSTTIDPHLPAHDQNKPATHRPPQHGGKRTYMGRIDNLLDEIARELKVDAIHPAPPDHQAKALNPPLVPALSCSQSCQSLALVLVPQNDIEKFAKELAQEQHNLDNIINESLDTFNLHSIEISVVDTNDQQPLHLVHNALNNRVEITHSTEEQAAQEEVIIQSVLPPSNLTEPPPVTIRSTKKVTHNSPLRNDKVKKKRPSQTRTKKKGCVIQ